MNIKEIIAGIVIAAILVILLKLVFSHNGNESGTISPEVLEKIDSLQRSSAELKIKNSVLEERIIQYEEDERRIESSKETVKQIFTQKKNEYALLPADDKETAFKNYLKNSNPDLYKKLYGDK